MKSICIIPKDFPLLFKLTWIEGSGGAYSIGRLRRPPYVIRRLSTISNDFSSETKEISYTASRAFMHEKLFKCSASDDQHGRHPHIRGGIKKFWASGIFPIQIVQCFTPNVQKCVRYWLHLGSYCWLSLFSHNTWSKIHTPIELAKWTKLSTERW